MYEAFITKQKNRYKLKLQDVQGKQDTIVSLRSQLEDIKSLNLELSTKLAESKRTVQVKEELILMMESKVIFTEHSTHCVGLCGGNFMDY